MLLLASIYTAAAAGDKRACAVARPYGRRRVRAAAVVAARRVRKRFSAHNACRDDCRRAHTTGRAVHRPEPAPAYVSSLTAATTRVPYGILPRS
jgi:hypothetical protein